MPCRSDKSARGVARFGHLSDGNIHLVMVRKCSRLRYLRFLISMSGGLTAGRSSDGIVEVVPAIAVRVEPVGRSSAATSSPKTGTPSSSPVFPNGMSNEFLSTQPLPPKAREEVVLDSETYADKARHHDGSAFEVCPETTSVTGAGERDQRHSRVSSWNIDGELLHCAAITAETHRGAIEVFARGVETNVS